MKTITTGSGAAIRAARFALLLLGSALAVAPARAQATDARFQPWLGCWLPENSTPATTILGTPVDGPNSMACVVPASSGSGVTVLSIVNGKVARREQIDGTGQRQDKTLENCPGWQTSSWSRDGHRLFLRSEYSCGGLTTVKASGIMAISSIGEWMQVEGTAVGQNASTAAIRYHAAGLELLNVAELQASDSAVARTTPVATSFAVRTIRSAAGGVLGTDDVIDVARHVDSPVAEAWLNELGQKFDLSGQTLVALADAGMPGSTIDLLVALSYPERFAVRKSEQDNRAVGNSAYGAGSYGYPYASSAGYSCYDPFYDPWMPTMYGMSSGYGCGYDRRSYNSGFYYYGNRPIIIVSRGSESPARTTGHAVNGRGYTRDSGPSDPSRTASPRSDGAGSTSRPATTRTTTGSSSGSGSSGSSSGGTSTGRTAHRRPPA